MKNVCVFCGSAPGQNILYAEAARNLGQELVRRGCGLVYGGGRIGLMGEVSQSVIAAGGHVVGVIPQSLASKEIAYEGATELHIVDTMHQRKALMADRADAFLALPGGYGTFEELFEILTWAQLGIHRKPIGLLNVNGFYSPLLACLDHVMWEGLLKPKHRELLLVSDSIADLLDRMAAWTPPAPVEKWVSPEER